MNKFIKLEKVITILALSILLLVLFIICMDVISFYDDKEKYAQIYRTSFNEATWEWDYISKWVYIGLFILSGLIVFSLRLMTKRNRPIIISSRIFLTLFLGIIVFALCRWMFSGYDY